jgi:hypothetical protein
VTAGEPLREVARGDGASGHPPLSFKRRLAAGATSRIVVTTASTGAVVVQIAVAESPDSATLAKRLRPRSPADCAEWKALLAYASKKIDDARVLLDAEQQARLAKALAGASESPDRVGELSLHSGPRLTDGPRTSSSGIGPSDSRGSRCRPTRKSR